MDLQLKGKSALVTGASAGIGRAIATELGKEGVRLVVTGRRRPELEKLRDEIVAAGGARPGIVVHDAMDEDYVDAVAKECEKTLGEVEILMNNAGGSRAFGKDATDQQWTEAFTLNFTRHRQLTLRFLPAMQAKNWGRVIYITGKQEPDGVNGAFCAKAALTAFSKGLSREVGKQGITVNCIGPGRIMSDQIRRNYTPEYRQWQSDNEIPMGRYGEPEDLAVLAVFLASPRAGYITGTVSPVDGGLRRYQY